MHCRRVVLKTLHLFLYFNNSESTHVGFNCYANVELSISRWTLAKLVRESTSGLLHGFFWGLVCLGFFIPAAAFGCAQVPLPLNLQTSLAALAGLWDNLWAGSSGGACARCCPCSKDSHGDQTRLLREGGSLHSLRAACATACLSSQGKVSLQLVPAFPVPCPPTVPC